MRIVLLMLLSSIPVHAAGITVSDLPNQTGLAGQTVIVLGYAQIGDQGGCVFYWNADVPHGGPDGGTVIAAKDGGGWKRLFTGEPCAQWFGVCRTMEPTTEDMSVTAARTTRLQAALGAARGNVLRLGPGIHYISDTLIVPANTRIEGVGPMDVSSGASGGTTLETVGDGTAQIWQDTGDPKQDVLVPLLVFGGNNVHARNIGLKTGNGSSVWDVGVLMPSVKRCSLEHVAIDGRWKVAACLLDATWTDQNKRMIDLHKGKIHPSHMNECDIYSCFLSGYNGLMIRGATERHPDDFPGDKWIWSFGGTSDINVISCRIEGKGLSSSDRDLGGAAYYSDAPIPNAANAGQGHRFIACNLRTKNTKYMVYLKRSNRDRFTDCYFEGMANDQRPTPVMMHNESPATGQVTINACKFSGVDLKTEWSTQNVSIWP